MMSNIVLYAPNVHTGGGLVLLRALIESLPRYANFFLVLDVRAKEKLEVPEGSRIRWVNSTILARIRTELFLRKLAREFDKVFCFHGLPPLLRVSAHISVFFQNRNYLGLNSLAQFPLRTALRLRLERLLSRMLRKRVSEYIVQTPSMARELTLWYQGCSDSIPLPNIKIRPFINLLPMKEPLDSVAIEEKWDFIYVADGIAHKNHSRLFEAWEILAQDNIRPRLAVTLGGDSKSLILKINDLRSKCRIDIVNLGELPYNAAIKLYRSSRALIYPSLSESYGLPLIEASRFGIPIIASELDYVRDVCSPVQTFNPESPTSIALAVRRFLLKKTDQIEPISPDAFLTMLLSAD